ncbi:MAG: prolipoprotein diacylglyceryl transferase, partial [Tissierellia bacterium]|nr:prolipoprotein diacylglyceryl transferase [Tissierellia bacterium]
MNPVAFTIFGLEVRWYGILIATGVFLAMMIATNLAKKTKGMNEELVTDFVLWVLPIGVLGARLYYVLFSW